MMASKKGKKTLLIYIGWTRAHDFCGKKQNQNTKSSPKFRRATYTIEIVTIKKRYGFDSTFAI